MNWWGIYMATIVSLPAVGLVVMVAVLTKPGGRR